MYEEITIGSDCEKEVSKMAVSCKGHIKVVTTESLVASECIH